MTAERRLISPPVPVPATAFKAIGRACFRQIVGNEPALLKGDPEGVHQMRVGLRRLRAALSLFADMLPDPQTAAIKTGLQWLQGELGPAREFEVLMKRVVAPVKKRRARWDGMPSLSHELAEKREAALSRAQDAVKSARFHALTLDIAAWLETGDWTRPRDDRIRDRRPGPDRGFRRPPAGPALEEDPQERQSGRAARCAAPP